MTKLQLNTVESSTVFNRRNVSGQALSITPVGGTEKTKPLLARETRTKGLYNFFQSDSSRTIEELQNDPVFGTLWKPAQPELSSPLETSRDQRLAILAREFEGIKLTREDEARLAIVTQRLRRLAPKITTRSWTIAEEVLAELEGVSARIDDIGAKYGL